MAIEFLGNKNKLLEFIFSVINEQAGDASGGFIDLFSGTSAVSIAAKKAGYTVTANDSLQLCVKFAEASLLNNKEPSFKEILKILPVSKKNIKTNKPVEIVLNYLNSLKPVKGFICKNYSPLSKEYSQYERMYFTEGNAGRIDSIRNKIRDWSGVLTKAEEATLIVCLIRASNRVANTAGTYGCYLKKWKKRSLDELVLVPIEVIESNVQHAVYNENANDLLKRVGGKVIYADPPYTKRQYAAYYHVLETIACGDEPEIDGSTGLRSWQHLSSDYCYKRKAPAAITDLVSKLDCEHFFLSYNEDGQIPHDVIIDILSKRGRVTTHEKKYKRYKSSTLSHKGNYLVERLYHLEIT
tara:strand:- start:8205 stop:9266 length:1062 start_codon:yes stop_codon:yes gene_type:complete